MNRRWLHHCLTEDERLEFEDRGYLIIENALSDAKRRLLTKAVDRINAEEREKQKIEPISGFTNATFWDGILHLLT